jgi:hypothetical protein
MEETETLLGAEHNVPRPSIALLKQSAADVVPRPPEARRKP